MSERDLELHDGRKIPRLGFGTWRIPNEETAEAVRTAIEVGYRSIDTAEMYGNEEGVGEGIRSSGVERDEIFVTTKLLNDRQGYDETLRAFDESLERLGMEEVDLYLIHWPRPKANLYVETWRAFVRIHQEGRARSIGVSNFHESHLERIIGETGVVPVLDQVELHPFFQQRKLRAYLDEKGIVTESWSPLARAKHLDEAILRELARKHGKTAAQIVIRWHLDSGLVTIPKSIHPERIRENFDVFDFKLDEDDMARLATLDRGLRTNVNPDHFG